MADEKNTRIAIVNEERCKPKRCRLECKAACPLVRMGKLCIEVESKSKKVWISEELCIGCGICVKKCPFNALEIINLPKNLSKHTTHRYSANSFKLHRLPTPRPNQVLGLAGQNGIGKSSAIKILSGKQKPNLGRFGDDAPDWEEVLTYFRGSELQGYFQKILEDNIKCIVKPQYVDQIPKAVTGNVVTVLRGKTERDNFEELEATLELSHLRERNVDELSGGELQRFAICVVCVQNADVYMFDEPSSYLDVKQRLTAARVIRSLVGDVGVSVTKYVVVIEHDLSVLDYLSDFICVLYGKPGVYGVVTMPFSVREGINIFLAGTIPTENMRFRDEPLTFKLSERAEEAVDPDGHYRRQVTYPAMVKTYEGEGAQFRLNIESGDFANSEIICLMGENGTGKTSFIRLLAGLLKPDETGVDVPELNVSYKPQKISPKFKGTVAQLLAQKIRATFMAPQFQTEVMKPLLIEDILDNDVLNLSGGELQRVAIALCLGQAADVYLIDEPSAYLDAEQRIVAAKCIKRYILSQKKTAFIVEHDFIMGTFLADRVIVFSGQPGIDATAHTPQSLLTGMNRFLSSLEITFRRDPTNFRPRINKLNSVKDTEQKASGSYFFLDTGHDDE